MRRIEIAILALLGTLVLGACALDSTDPAEAGDAMGLRLLVGNGQQTTLSHPDYDDWAPQLAWACTNTVSATGCNFLYFLSTRPSPGHVSPGRARLFRAMEVRPGVYSNVQFVTENGSQELFTFSVKNDSTTTNPDIYVTSRPEVGLVRVNRLWWDGAYGQYYAASEPYLSDAPGDLGLANAVFTPYGNSWLSSVDPVRGLQCTPFESTWTNSFLAIRTNYFPLALMLARAGMPSVTVDGFCPVVLPKVMRTAPGRIFGMLLSADGRLVFAWPGSAWDPWHDNGDGGIASDPYSAWLFAYSHPSGYSTDPVFAGDLVVPVEGFSHPPGSRDTTPFYDVDSGLYFSSDRAGSRDLYFVPADRVRVGVRQ